MRLEVQETYWEKHLCTIRERLRVGRERLWCGVDTYERRKRQLGQEAPESAVKS